MVSVGTLDFFADIFELRKGGYLEGGWTPTSVVPHL